MKVIVITGITSGLGNSLFNLLVAQDYLIIGLSRNINSMLKARERNGKNVYLIESDLANKNNIEYINKLKETLIEVKAKHIYFFNNAGVVDPIKRVGDFSIFSIEQNIQVNYTTPILISNLLVSLGKKINIINIGSGAADSAIECWSLYCAAKAGMKMYFEVLNAENSLVEVSQIDPGVMDTKMQTKIRLTEDKNFTRHSDFIEYHRIGLLKSPQKVANDILTKIGLLK